MIAFHTRSLVFDYCSQSCCLEPITSSLRRDFEIFGCSSWNAVNLAWWEILVSTQRTSLQVEIKMVKNRLRNLSGKQRQQWQQNCNLCVPFPFNPLSPSCLEGGCLPCATECQQSLPFFQTFIRGLTTRAALSPKDTLDLDL